ncbi:hypothetical protein [Nostoc sp. DedQUE04]|uniref:hypothetical protein n=1 Tax=Nostoc sp. DedQUE04 TaxID=3075390 RepID=UPI002AD2E3A9|nr:hypothetical protein [Nostoc sp. DedQUE04]
MPHTPQWIYIVFWTFSTIVMIFVFRHDWNHLAKLYSTQEAPPQNFSRIKAVLWV